MRKRTKAREFALKVLYHMEIAKSDSALSLAMFWKREKNAEESVRLFTEKLVRGIEKKRSVIDENIGRCATNWQISRMAVIDRNILRIAAYELLFETDIPKKVSINEAIDIAKKYGDTDSGKFVNGILDKIARIESNR